MADTVGVTDFGLLLPILLHGGGTLWGISLHHIFTYAVTSSLPISLFFTYPEPHGLSAFNDRGDNGRLPLILPRHGAHLHKQSAPRDGGPSNRPRNQGNRMPIVLAMTSDWTGMFLPNAEASQHQPLTDIHHYEGQSI
jgi:hypothetical protein